MCRVVTRPEEIVSAMGHHLVEDALDGLLRHITSLASGAKLSGLDSSLASLRLFSAAVVTSTVGSRTHLIFVIHVGIRKLDESDGLAFVLIRSNHFI